VSHQISITAKSARLIFPSFPLTATPWPPARTTPSSISSSSVGTDTKTGRERNIPLERHLGRLKRCSTSVHGSEVVFPRELIHPHRMRGTARVKRLTPELWPLGRDQLVSHHSCRAATTPLPISRLPWDILLSRTVSLDLLRQTHLWQLRDRCHPQARNLIYSLYPICHNISFQLHRFSNNGGGPTSTTNGMDRVNFR